MKLDYEITIVNLDRHNNGWTAVVEIGNQSDQSTTHHVVVDDDYYEHVTSGHVDAESLVELSFEFLLEHESPESILRQFDLDLIGNYFPSYESEMQKKIEEFNK